MMKNYFPGRIEYDDNYEDICPTILKQQTLHFKKVLLCSSLCFVRIWNKICCLKKYKGARNSRTLTNGLKLK
jgi:hypothetical protein